MDYQEFENNFTWSSQRVTNEFSHPTIIQIGALISNKETRLVAYKSGRSLEEEAKIHKSISSFGSHPGVIQFISDIYDDGDFAGFLMEGVDNGLNLSEFSLSLRDGNAKSYEECVDMIMQIALALEHLHGIGLIHHDLKTKNILVKISETGKLILKICDFGISEYVNDQRNGSEELRECGTYSSMAPEQRDEFASVTQKIDIYAFAGIGFCILGMGRHYKEMELNAPRFLLKLLCRCQDKDPNLRPSIKEVVETLRTMKMDNSKDILINKLKLIDEKIKDVPDSEEKNEIIEIRKNIIEMFIVDGLLW